MNKIKDWKKYHRFKKPAGGASRDQCFSQMRQKDTRQASPGRVKDWWGTSQQMIMAYLSRFFVSNLRIMPRFPYTDHWQGDLIIVNGGRF